MPLPGFTIFEFSTLYFTKNYLVPYQESGLLRNIASSGIAPIVIGLWGLRNLYDEVGKFPFISLADDADDADDKENHHEVSFTGDVSDLDKATSTLSKL